MTNELESLTADYLPAIEDEMRAVLRADGAGAGDPFYGMIHYHMGWADEALRPAGGNSGKRIRPLLCLLASAAAGGDWQQAVPAAAAIEILHNFSLVHDDIQDNSPTRRGRSTVWTLWGQPQAINTGDAMFALAFAAIQRLSNCGAAPTTTLAALQVFTDTCIALTEGQYLDMSFEQRATVTVDEYLRMIEGKTAALVGASVAIGALIGGASPAQAAALRELGVELGQGFLFGRPGPLPT